MSTKDAAFTGSVPAIYEKYLVPLIFEHYAAELAERLAANPPARVLELAAGTGVVTRALAKALPAASEIVATDLNPAMLEEAKKRGTSRRVDWQPADAQELRYDDGFFDAVVCQYGVMFFPDKAKAFAEAQRVLKPGGRYVFSVWDRLADNEIADAVNTAVGELWPADPPRFLARTPYNYNDIAQIRADLAAGGFTAPAEVDCIMTNSRAPSARDAVMGFCQGSPLRAEIEQRKSPTLEQATDAAAKRVAKLFGKGPVEARMQALVVTVSR